MEQTDVALLIRLSAYRKHIGVPYSQLQIIQRNEHCTANKINNLYYCNVRIPEC